MWRAEKNRQAETGVKMKNIIMIVFSHFDTMHTERNKNPGSRDRKMLNFSFC